MIDIVTVVFREELPVLQVQAQSIQRYAVDLGIKNIYVMVNDDDDLVKQIDSAWWGQFAPVVKIISRDVFDSTWVENGWVSQQVLKLLGSAESKNTWTMVLDAKTLLVDHVSWEMFVLNHSQLTLGFQPVISVFEPAAHIAGQLFGIQVQGVAQPAGVPFIFHNQTVRDMIIDIEQKVGQSFATWFQQQGMLTEFVLYSTYVQYKNKDIKQVYLDTNQRSLCNNICHSEVDKFDHKLDLAKSQNPLTIGIHRRAWSQISQPQQKRYVEYLISRGLTRASLLL
jgi:hypothetical protein